MPKWTTSPGDSGEPSGKSEDAPNGGDGGPRKDRHWSRTALVVGTVLLFLYAVFSALTWGPVALQAAGFRVLALLSSSKSTNTAISAGVVTESQENSVYYFRLKARYSHAGKPVDFDIVVACGIQVTRYRGGETGFLASRYPRFFVQRTHDDHEVMQIVPIACRGETTENGLVPADFLPGAIWFDKPGDHRFGIAYVGEDAFENPNSQLKFHGASIESATRAEWEAFEKRAADNEGMRSRYYDRAYYSPEDGQRIAEGGGNEVEAAYARGCTGVIRHKLSDAGRAVLRKYWPANKPRYWTTNKRDDGPWPELVETERTTSILASGRRYVEHFYGANYKYGGFPTRAGNGMMHSKSRKVSPSEIFPARFDRGVPWVFTEEVSRSDYLTKDVEIRTAPGIGILYCYTYLNPGAGKLEIPIPNFRSRESRIRVDNEWVITSQPQYWSWPTVFYEGDEYMYVELNIGLS